MKKMLIIYYSWSNGNTERVAKQLQAATGADSMRIETVQPYEGGYDAVVRQGQDEVEAGYEPPICPTPYDVQDYDIIAIGTPTWWYTMAPAVKTFFARQQLARQNRRAVYDERRLAGHGAARYARRLPRGILCAGKRDPL